MYQSSALRTKLQARLTKYETALDAALDALADLQSQDMTIQHYKLDTGEGMQAVTERELQSFERRIMWLEAQINSLRQRLAGLGVVSITTKRRF